MMLKVFDLLRSLTWYIITFIYGLIDTLLEIIKQLNAFDIIDTLSSNNAFKGLYTGIIVIAITLFALFTIWKFINKFLEPDDSSSFKNIIIEVAKCGVLIMMSTFLFIQVSNFSITLGNYTANVFENNSNTTMSNSILSMFITYNDNYKNSDKFNEDKSIDDLVNNGSFNNDELYLSKFVTKSKIIFSDEKDYKYEINWIMAIVCGGFFLYSLLFAGILLGRRQIEFLFLFLISPIVFAVSVCNKQRRGAVIEQLASLTFQSAVVMLIVNLTVMVMLEINTTTFFDTAFMNVTTKSLLYIGCATFILTGSQIINRFIGANVSAASGREQLMSLIGYGKMAGVGATVATGTAIGGTLLAAGGTMKAGKSIGSDALSKIGLSLGSYGSIDSSNGQTPTQIQKLAKAMGTKMYMTGQNMKKNISKDGKISTSDIFINAGANSLDNAVRKVIPRASYNSSYYRRRKNMN